MRASFTSSTFVASAMLLLAGCQSTGPSQPLLGSTWPWWGSRTDQAVAAQDPALPQKPSATATPGGYPTGYAVAGTTPASGYPQTSTPQASAFSAYPGQQPGASAGGEYLAGGYGATSSGQDTNAAHTGVQAQVGPYDASYGQYSAGTTPAGYVTEQDPSGYSATQTPYAAEAPGPRYASHYPTAGQRQPSSPYAGSPSGEGDASQEYPAQYEPGASHYPDSGTGYNAGQTDYQPGETDYQPGETGYHPGDTGYQPAGVPRYQTPANDTGYETEAAAPAADPHYRPGGTGDYLPPRASPSAGQPAADAQPSSSVPRYTPSTSSSRYGSSYQGDVPAGVSPPAGAYPAADPYYGSYER